mmetsp:Transcript_33867/g.99575  ORF Transcript_33867/g.99575 Transcript_33867/m.99575 type:complete len:895 (+) Transcript_33867:320-3004(+)
MLRRPLCGCRHGRRAAARVRRRGGRRAEGCERSLERVAAWRVAVRAPPRVQVDVRLHCHGRPHGAHAGPLRPLLADAPHRARHRQEHHLRPARARAHPHQRLHHCLLVPRPRGRPPHALRRLRARRQRLHAVLRHRGGHQGDRLRPLLGAGRLPERLVEPARLARRRRLAARPRPLGRRPALRDDAAHAAHAAAAPHDRQVPRHAHRARGARAVGDRHRQRARDLRALPAHVRHPRRLALPRQVLGMHRRAGDGPQAVHQPLRRGPDAQVARAVHRQRHALPLQPARRARVGQLADQLRQRAARDDHSFRGHVARQLARDRQPGRRRDVDRVAGLLHHLDHRRHLLLHEPLRRHRLLQLCAPQEHARRLRLPLVGAEDVDRGAAHRLPAARAQAVPAAREGHPADLFPDGALGQVRECHHGCDRAQHDHDDADAPQPAAGAHDLPRGDQHHLPHHLRLGDGHQAAWPRLGAVLQRRVELLRRLPRLRLAHRREPRLHPRLRLERRCAAVDRPLAAHVPRAAHVPPHPRRQVAPSHHAHAHLHAAVARQPLDPAGALPLHLRHDGQGALRRDAVPRARRRRDRVRQLQLLPHRAAHRVPHLDQRLVARTDGGLRQEGPDGRVHLLPGRRRHDELLLPQPLHLGDARELLRDGEHGQHQLVARLRRRLPELPRGVVQVRPRRHRPHRRRQPAAAPARAPAAARPLAPRRPHRQVDRGAGAARDPARRDLGPRPLGAQQPRPPAGGALRARRPRVRYVDRRAAGHRHPAAPADEPADQEGAGAQRAQVAPHHRGRGGDQAGRRARQGEGGPLSEHRRPAERRGEGRRHRRRLVVGRTHRRGRGRPARGAGGDDDPVPLPAISDPLPAARRRGRGLRGVGGARAFQGRAQAALRLRPV